MSKNITGRVTILGGLITLHMRYHICEKEVDRMILGAKNVQIFRIGLASQKSSLVSFFFRLDSNLSTEISY